MSATCSSLVWGQGLTVPAAPLSKPPVIDGILTEGEWTEARHLTPLVDEQTSRPTADLTEAWVGVTAEGFYIAVYAHDTQPDKIVGRTIQRGVRFEGEDFVGLSLDPMNRRSSGGISNFSVNSLGTQWETIAGGRASKLEWRGDWKAAAKRVGDGYIVEMFIPWGMLNFPSNRKGNLLFNVSRYQHRTTSFSLWSDTTLRKLPEHEGTMSGVQFPASPNKLRVETIGYISPEYDEENDPRFSLRAGLDIRVRPTPVMTGLLSLNPDFRNIEGEIAGIEFTRSERFVADVRPFFTEGSNYFNLTGNYTIGRMFYSRRIDDFDQGVKLFGDLSPTTQLGALATREDGKRTDTVVRVRRQLDARSEVSLYSTHRSDDGVDNTVVGSAGRFGRGNYSLEYDLVSSDDSTGKGNATSFAAMYAIPRFLSIVRWMEVDPDFKNRLGFIPFTDYRGLYAFNGYETEYRTGSIRQFTGSFFVENLKRFDGSNFSQVQELELDIETRSDFGFEFLYLKEKFEDEDFTEYGLSVTANVSNRFKQLELGYFFGDRAGDPSAYLELSGSYRIFDGVDIGLRHSVLNFQGIEDQTILTLGWEKDKTQSLTARWVKNNDDSNWYLSYRNAGGKGTEYYFIVGDPNARTVRDRIAFKVVWAR